MGWLSSLNWGLILPRLDNIFSRPTVRITGGRIWWVRGLYFFPNLARATTIITSEIRIGVLPKASLEKGKRTIWRLVP